MTIDRTGAKYLIAVAIALAAAALRLGLAYGVGHPAPFLTFYLAIVAAAAYGGFGPGLLATLLGAVDGLVADASAGPMLASSAERVRLAFYLLSGIGISIIAGRLHQANHRLDEEAAEARRAGAQLNRANERLREGDAQKDRFLAVLAHELRNPLMPIRNSLVVIRRAPEKADAVARSLRIIERQVDHMTYLVNELLDVTRITHDKLDLHRTRVDLRELALRTLEDHRPVFQQGGIALHEDVAGEPLHVHADAARIRQVLGNLLHNAMKFTPAGGSVHVAAGRDEAGIHAVLRVRDTGRGIRAELLEDIFHPFAQGDAAADRAAGGLGLGLALVQRLVQLHGGSVQALSAGPGQGAEFVVTLPLDRAPELPDRIQPVLVV